MTGVFFKWVFVSHNTISAQIRTTLIQTVVNVNKIYLVSQGLENNDKQKALSKFIRLPYTGTTVDNFDTLKA